MVITQEQFDIKKKKKIDINRTESSYNSKDHFNDIYGLIQSSSVPGGYYLISGEEGNLKCSCPQCKIKGLECKHLIAIKNGKSSCLRISGSVPETDGKHP